MTLDPKILDGLSWQSDRKEGLFAELDASGNVRKLAFYTEERAVELDASARHPRYTDHKESRWSPAGELTKAAWLEARASAILDLARAAQIHELRCSFCGKSQREVAKIIAGPTVYICDECVRLCAEILQEPLP